METHALEAIVVAGTEEVHEFVGVILGVEVDLRAKIVSSIDDLPSPDFVSAPEGHCSQRRGVDLCRRGHRGTGRGIAGGIAIAKRREVSAKGEGGQRTRVAVAGLWDAMYRNRMCMIDEQVDSRAMLGEWLCRPLLFECRGSARLSTALKLNVLIEFDEKESLILYVSEEVVLPNEGEDAWSAELEEVGERFAGLAVKDVAAPKDQR